MGIVRNVKERLKEFGKTPSLAKGKALVRGICKGLCSL